MPKNNLAALLKEQFKKGSQSGGVYWTMVMTVAIHNLYGWKGNAFDKIEREMERIDKEMKQDDMLLNTERLFSCIASIRGQDYVDGTRKVLEREKNV